MAQDKISPQTQPRPSAFKEIPAELLTHYILSSVPPATLENFAKTNFPFAKKRVKETILDSKFWKSHLEKELVSLKEEWRWAVENKKDKEIIREKIFIKICEVIQGLTPQQIEHLLPVLQQILPVGVIENEENKNECQLKTLTSLLLVASLKHYPLTDLPVTFAKLGAAPDFEFEIRNPIPYCERVGIWRYAIEKNNVALIKAFIEVGAPLAKKNTPLIAWAACYDTTGEMIATLIEAGENVQQELRRGEIIQLGDNHFTQEFSTNNALHIAVSMGKYAIAQLLIETGILIDALNSNKKTPLRIAFENNNCELIRLLLAAGASLKVADEGHDISCIDLAIRADSVSILQLLIKEHHFSMNAPRSNGYTIFQQAIIENRAGILAYLLTQTPAFTIADKNGYYPLHLAVIHNHLEIVASLVNKVDINQQVFADGNTSLHLAIIKKHDQVAQLLIKRGADLNIANALGETPLHLAVANNNFAMVVELINAGAEVNHKNCSGKTALHIAIENNNPQIVNALIAGGADVHSKFKSDDNCNGAPLKVAVKKGSVEIVEALLAAGAIPNKEVVKAAHLALFPLIGVTQYVIDPVSGKSEEKIDANRCAVAKLLVKYNANFNIKKYSTDDKTVADQLKFCSSEFQTLANLELEEKLMATSNLDAAARKAFIIKHRPQNFLEYLETTQKKIQSLISHAKINQIFSSNAAAVEKVKQAFNYYHGLSVGKFTLSFSSRFWPKVHCHHHKKTVAALLQKLDSAQTVADCQQVIRHAMAEAKKDAHYNSTGTFALLCAQVLTNLGKMAQQELQAGVSFSRG